VTPQASLQHKEPAAAGVGLLFLHHMRHHKVQHLLCTQGPLADVKIQLCQFVHTTVACACCDVSAAGGLHSGCRPDGPPGQCVQPV
jgi:hypothetical protein